MPNNHLITRQIGNLRGFSTDSIYIRPPNVATDAINLQMAPDGTLQLRRGYQCQIGEIGGMGIGTFDDPVTDRIQTVCIGTDGFLYNKITRQIFLEYDGQVTGTIIGVTNAILAEVHSIGHGLQTGAQVIIRDVGGMVNLNNNTYTITFVDADHYTLDGVDSTLFPAYTSGGYWSIAFADNRYLTFSIFTDPAFIYSNSGQSISCNILVNRAAQINGNQSLVNTITVQFGHELAATDVVQFYSSTGVFTQRNVTGITATSITIDGAPVSVNDGVYINQLIYIMFGKGFDVVAPYTIAQFISAITDPITGVFGLEVAINGISNLPAAFLQIVEPTIIDNNIIFNMDYWYWNKVNFTENPPFPGSANPDYQNSYEFENAAMAVYDDVIYITNGWDFPQKYDGQTVYRTGMPEGMRVQTSDNTTFTSLPFATGNVYQYGITYLQVDNKGHVIEGEISNIQEYTVVAAAAAINVTVTNLQSTPGNNWNTNGALAVGGVSTSYGPDINGFYYDLVALYPGFTLKIGDTAYYGDTTCAVLNGGVQTGVTFSVAAGHGIEDGDTIYFFDSTNNEIQAGVISVTATTITIDKLDPITVNSGTHANILDYKTSLVFGNVAIVSGNQSNVNIINVVVGHTIQFGDIVEFIDSNNLLQRRNVIGVAAGNITIDGIPVSVDNLMLISSENQRTNALNFRRTNSNPATLSDGTVGNISNAISNNLRINIYRTVEGADFTKNDQIFLVASIPNDSSGAATQIYIDGLADDEIAVPFENPDRVHNPPPISKYIKCFGNQLFYAGGSRGDPENSDFVFFSIGDSPEAVSLASNSFIVPNVGDDITGIGVAGTTIVVTKNISLWAATGNFLSGNIDVVQIAPGTNIGCAAHATIASVGTLMYFCHTNGVYAITENQLFPTDAFGNPVPLSLAIDALFRETNFLPQTKYVFRRAVGFNYPREQQYWLFLPCEDVQSSIRTANANSILLAYDYKKKNWFKWTNMNAAGGIVSIDDEIYFQERRFSAVDGNTANLYKQHRFYRLVDHADHAGAQFATWTSSWEDIGQPEVRKKFCRCVLLMDRVSELLQYNNPIMTFSSYLNRIPNLQNTISTITQTDNIRNAAWSFSPWGWNFWSGYQDSFITVNLKQGTVAKSIQVGFQIQGINMDIRLAGYQLEAIPENRKTVVR